MTNDDWIKFSQAKTFKDIECFSHQYSNGELSFETIQHEISFLYNMGLFYSEYYETHDIIELIFRKEDKYYLAIFYYLKAIKLYEENKDTLDKDVDFIFEIIRRLYVNIANEFSNQFRSISALYYFRKALDIDNCFDMAIGNFALGIEHHNPLIGLDKDKYCLVFNLLYELYLDLHLENLDSGYKFFASKNLQYKKTQAAYIEAMVQGKDANYDPYAYFTDIDDISKTYENWCIKNTLYLNFVNDLGDYEEAKFDINLNNLNNELDLTKAQLCSLNNLFSLYVLERRKIYKHKNPDNNESSLELAQVFQCLYSYFDKIAFFIYRYFGLTGKERAVNINTIWDMKDEDGNCLTEYKNQYLYNIFWLRKEYRGNSQDGIKINELLSPDAQDYADIRNTLEHKEFSFEKIDGLTYLNPEFLFNKTVKLARVVRDMILSIIQMVKTERALFDSSTNKRNLDLVHFIYEGFK